MNRSARHPIGETLYHCSPSSFHPVDELEPVGGLPHLVPAPATASSLKTRAALLRLGDCPSDSSAINILWEENHEVIEQQMRRHLPCSSDATLRERVLSDVILQGKYFATKSMTRSLGWPDVPTLPPGASRFDKQNNFLPQRFAPRSIRAARDNHPPAIASSHICAPSPTQT
jgi:hypothetical protein